MTTTTPFDAASGVAFLGPAGTYSHSAAQALFGSKAPWQPSTDIREVFAAVESGKASWGVVPVENSTQGSITVTLDSFATSDLKIVAEYLLPVHHCLLVKAGTAQRQITRIYSHQQSLGQCRQYLDKHFPQAERVAVSSNAEAARLTAELNSGNAAAIAGVTAAELYGLQVLATNIEDKDDNTTRFLLLHRNHSTAPTGKDRTLLLIAASNEPGTLFHALEPFHRFGVSLTKLETRPSRGSAWSYMFYVELEGHIADAKVKAALAALTTLKLEVKWLGSYSQAEAGQVTATVPTTLIKQTPQSIKQQQQLALLQDKHIVIIGLGLIGGSVARALRKQGCQCRISAVGRNTAALEKAQADGAINQWSTELKTVCPGADLIILGMPVLSIEQSLRDLQPVLSPHTVVTDVASVKGAVVAAVQSVLGAVPANFVPGHPIAGSEQSGYVASKADLYQGRKVILTPLAQTNLEAVALVEAMWQLIGAEVLTMSVEHHDEVLAATSHLPHLLAFALVDTLSQQGTREEIFRYAAGGFRDFTRIASSDPVMWRDIFLTNAEATVSILDDYLRDLQRLRAVLLAHDGNELFATFQRAKASRDVFLALTAALKASR